MSQKPAKTTEEEKKKRKQKKKKQTTVTLAVPHIRLSETNAGKLEALDRLVVVYLALCQQYVTSWCDLSTEEDGSPDAYAAPLFASTLSERWHRVAMQQAAGIAKSWRTNRQTAYDIYLEDVANYATAQTTAEEDGVPLDPKSREPVWTEWKIPELRVPSIQANANVVLLERSEDSTFDYWLRISTLEKGQPLRVPVKLAAYHKQTLQDKKLNTSTTLCKRNSTWWLTLTFDEDIPRTTAKDAPIVGVDVGIANFLTTSTGQQYGTFHGKLARRHQRDRAKRRRKAKLRACLKRKGSQNCPRRAV